MMNAALTMHGRKYHALRIAPKPGQTRTHCGASVWLATRVHASTVPAARRCATCARLTRWP